MEYRLADRTAKPMGNEELKSFLDQPHIMRIGLIDERDGYPIVHPVWYYYEEGKFFAAIERNGLKTRSLRKNPNVYIVIDLDPDNGPPLGVRGKATARMVDDPDYALRVTDRNIVRYLGSLEGRTAQRIREEGKISSVVEITPAYLASWKF